jgi:RNA polymerase sigma-70 factor (ECF subfamily)
MAGATSPHLQIVDPQSVPEPVGDDELVARAQGDPEAFAVLYRRYVTPVYRYCRYRLSSPTAAEDATSEIFMKAFTGIRSYRNQCLFRSWLFAIAHNTVSDSYRAYRPEEPIEAADGMHDPDPSPEDRALFAEGERSVQALLKRVTPQQARILELRLAGLTGPEIAQVLGCSLAAVKIGQVRGYGRLREVLAGSPNAEGARS